MLKEFLHRRANQKPLRRIICLALVVSLALLLVASPVWAAIGVSFSNTGYKYIFSSNPEDIYSTALKYTINQSLSSYTTYDFELYHHNYSGASLKFGVALKNTSTATATVTINARVIRYSNPDPPSEVDMTAPLIRDYQQNYGATTIYINPGQCAWLMVLDVPAGKLVNGKVRMRSNVGLTARVFHGPTSTTPTQVFGSIPRDTAGNGVVTGFFNYDGKYNSSPIDASGNPTFILSEWPPNLNRNEYEWGQNLIDPSDGYLDANYGATYTITVTNAANKKLKITPNWSGGAQTARIVLYTPTYGWYTTTRLSPGQYWLMSMGTNSTFTFKYVLPGGNWGNMKFEVIN